MLGQKQDPFDSLLIDRNADCAARPDAAAGPNRFADAAGAMPCPACVRRMAHVRTIRSASQDDLQVFECRACNVVVSAKAPPRSS
jgi:hypothetical protein